MSLPTTTTTKILKDGCLAWEEFLLNAKELINLSDQINDKWELIKMSENDGETFLKYEQFTNFPIELNQTDLIHIEYHIIYSLSYQIPVLYFKGTHSDGSQITLDEFWGIFKNLYNKTNLENNNGTTSLLDLLKILTQTEHPLLFKPFFILHPCKTDDLLKNCIKSKNLLITFLSTYGPYILLNLNHNYCKYFK